MCQANCGFGMFLRLWFVQRGRFVVSPAPGQFFRFVPCSTALRPRDRPANANRAARQQNEEKAKSHERHRHAPSGRSPVVPHRTGVVCSEIRSASRG